MKNTEWYFRIVKRYREGLNSINAKYDPQIESKKSYAGSAGYAADMEKIEQQRAAEIEALRDDCWDSFKSCVDSMQEKAKNRPTVAPTQEQLAILQVLKMKEQITKDDLEHAAVSMGDCSLALDVLQELAQKHEIWGFHTSAGVSDAFVQDAIRQFARSARTYTVAGQDKPAPGTDEGHRRVACCITFI